MNRYYYDFHLHSCLSPCGDDDNTPNNIAGMAVICGLQIVALTDHNTTKNCPAFFQACERYGLIPVAGMELTTSEDIHVVCLFETLEDAMAFSDAVSAWRVLYENRTDIFGHQWMTDGEDHVIGEEKYYLPNATNISLEEVPSLVNEYNGICYPAHIDRQANGIISILGTFPETPHFTMAEISQKEKVEEIVARYSLVNKRILIGSDAHCLTAIRDKENYFEIDDEPYSAALVRHRLFEILRGNE